MTNVTIVLSICLGAAAVIVLDRLFNGKEREYRAYIERLKQKQSQAKLKLVDKEIENAQKDLDNALIEYRNARNKLLKRDGGSEAE